MELFLPFIHEKKQEYTEQISLYIDDIYPNLKEEPKIEEEHVIIIDVL